jgi:hypothetical protein
MISSRGKFLLSDRGRRGRWTFGSTVAAAAAVVLSRRSHDAAAFTVHRSFSELIPLYDAFILDQFGTILGLTKRSVR